ncbi:MAG: tetratricopeptide repeat protein [Oryzomonas sp.]|uniref:tetratricopeptide repeat protein n=1 Tax=Oryzomonas sp. TaxID=2855186 RepID=UPI00284EE851|nr:tetratricopeptide repeat protein [Oryzomonas sp.]MDR3579547.1 tetratricopeptide repeat protein [Oryzomonas sp.]
MSASVFDSMSGYVDLTSIYQSAQSQQKQMAQYTIAQAANLMGQNKNAKAITLFKQALGMDPQNTTAYSYLGQLYLAQGDNNDAINTFKKLVSVMSASASSYTTAATSSSSTTSATPTLQTAYVSLGNAYLQNKQYSDSEKAFKKAEQLNPRDPVAPYTLGQQYLTQGNLSGALTQFEKAQKISPNDGNVYYALGEVCNKMGDYKDAVASLTKSLYLKSNFPSANYQLGVAYNGLGQTADAQKQLTILKGSNTSLASQLQNVLSNPQMVTVDSMATQNNKFDDILGPATPLWYLDTSLSTPNSSETFSMTIAFNNAMDVSSITNPANWTLSRANSPEAGYYNDMMPQSSKDAAIPPTPLSVTYNTLTNEATVNFQLSQNADGSAVIDPSHIVFTFNGKDAQGRTMDQAANSVDGANAAPF